MRLYIVQSNVMVLSGYFLKSNLIQCQKLPFWHNQKMMKKLLEAKVLVNYSFTIRIKQQDENLENQLHPYFNVV